MPIETYEIEELALFVESKIEVTIKDKIVPLTLDEKKLIRAVITALKEHLI